MASDDRRSAHPGERSADKGDPDLDPAAIDDRGAPNTRHALSLELGFRIEGIEARIDQIGHDRFELCSRELRPPAIQHS